VEDQALVFRKGDVKDLGKKLEYMLEHPDMVQEYGSRSADFICRKFNWDEVVGETAELYRACCGRR
ncbi:MAG: glycosyl transferase family 1, partial [Lachnospiraceae bacterium]|nr:glycosyl transferase family 1 [Lachnospiraceae bacterium]